MDIKRYRRTVITSGLLAFFLTPSFIVGAEGGALPCPAFFNLILGLVPNLLNHDVKSRAIWNAGFAPISIAWAVILIFRLRRVIVKNNEVKK